MLAFPRPAWFRASGRPAERVNGNPRKNQKQKKQKTNLFQTFPKFAHTPSHKSLEKIVFFGFLFFLFFRGFPRFARTPSHKSLEMETLGKTK